MLKKQISKEQIRKCLDSMYLVAFALFLALAFMYTTTFEIEWPEYLYYNVRLFNNLFFVFGSMEKKLGRDYVECTFAYHWK